MNSYPIDWERLYLKKSETAQRVEEFRKKALNPENPKMRGCGASG